MARETPTREAPLLQPPDPPPKATVRIVQAHLERGRYSWMWVVLTCPFCGKPHDHYAGPLDGDPSRYLGQTVPARCDRTDRRRLLMHQPALARWYVLTASQLS